MNRLDLSLGRLIALFDGELHGDNISSLNNTALSTREARVKSQPTRPLMSSDWVRSFGPENRSGKLPREYSLARENSEVD